MEIRIKFTFDDIENINNLFLKKFTTKKLKTKEYYDFSILEPLNKDILSKSNSVFNFIKYYNSKEENDDDIFTFSVYYEICVPSFNIEKVKEIVKDYLIEINETDIKQKFNIKDIIVVSNI